MKDRRNKILRLVLCFFSWLIFSNSYGQQPLYKSFDIRSENTRPRILKLLLDHNGRIWAGTDKGIFTFDGINFQKIFNPDTGFSFVSSLFEDKSSCIWAGYENGKIVCIKNQVASLYTSVDTVPKVSISGFSEDKEGRIYFSTKGMGIYYIENKRLHRISQDDGLSDGYCYCMVKLPDDRMCAGTDAGINFVGLSGGKKIVKEFGTSDGLGDDIVKALALDKNNILWVGFQENGLGKFDCTNNKILPVHLKKPWEYGQINNILVVEKELWIATEEKGIIIVDENGNVNNLQLGVERNIKANDLLFDLENNIWLAESIHLYRTSGNKLSFIPSLGKKTLQYIHCIAADKNGDIWFSPDQQLGHIHLSSDGKYVYNEYHILDKFVDIVSLYFDPYDYLWIGTLGAGIYRFNTQTGNVRKVSETLDVTNSSVLSINGRGVDVWVGGFNSVMKFIIRKNGNSDNAVIEKVPAFEESNLSNDYVYSVFIDSKGRTWFATDGGGVYYYENGKLNNIPVVDNVVHSFTEDKKNRIWYSTSDAGLEFVDTDGSIHKFQTRDGLSDPSPTSLLCTKTGNIIVVHANGFDLLNPENKTIIYHSSEENLADLNCDLNSIAESKDGSVWIGTERGILHYRPELEMKAERPKIVLRSVSVFLNAIDFKNKTEFDADENNFRFDYDGLWYTDPQRINYLFMLEGYSAKWESTKDHTVTFPKLPPANYVFRIKASLNGNFENAEEDTYTFIIHPPIWQRMWFRILISGFIALMILFIVRRREDRLRKFDKIQKEKIEFQFETLKSQVNPHFLFNSFNTLISVIENAPKNALEYVERLAEFFRNIVTYRETNLIRLSEELNILDNYVFIQKKRYGENLRLEISIDENIRNTKFIAPLILQMLAENAIKHNAVSVESPVIISISSEKDRLIISNNINPKITSEASTGLGLQNIIGRYQLLTKEKVIVSSGENKFIVTIPLLTSKNEHINN